MVIKFILSYINLGRIISTEIHPEIASTRTIIKNTMKKWACIWINKGEAYLSIEETVEDSHHKTLRRRMERKLKVKWEKICSRFSLI